MFLTNTGMVEKTKGRRKTLQFHGKHVWIIKKLPWLQILQVRLHRCIIYNRMVKLKNGGTYYKGDPPPHCKILYFFSRNNNLS